VNTKTHQERTDIAGWNCPAEGRKEEDVDLAHISSSSLMFISAANGELGALAINS
jgi:hypothetical protein